jgi:hypothetical protein
VNGDADPIIPIGGGSGINPDIGPIWGQDRLGEALARQRGCVRDAAPLEIFGPVTPSVVLRRAAGCDRPGQTDLYRITGGRHDGYGGESWKRRLFGYGGTFFAPELVLRSLIPLTQ